MPTPSSSFGKTAAMLAVQENDYALIERIIYPRSSPPAAPADRAFATGAMNAPKPHDPTPDAIRKARLAVGLTQTEAAHAVRASLRGWQQWEAGDRAMPPGLFELFMLKTGQWPLDGITERQPVR